MNTRPATLILVLLTLFCASPVSAFDDPPATFTITPDKIQTGKTRDVTITVESGDLSDYKLLPLPAGSGVTLISLDGKPFQLSNGNKSMIFRVSVDEDADLGPLPITISREKAPADVRIFNLMITEFMPRRLSRQPTPDDISEVDITGLTVLPYKLTKDIFGRRAADSFYAIDITIGNNSGFDLRIVSLGFDSTLGMPTTDANGIPLQPLKGADGKSILDEYGNQLIPAVDSNGNPILRDGKPTYRALKRYQMATVNHRLVRGTVEKDQLYGSRALTMNLIGGVGTLVSGFLPFYHNPNPRANFSTFSSILNGQFKEGFGLSAPDLTVSQLNRLENMVMHDGLTIPNNDSVQTIVFFPKHVIMLTPEERKLVDKGITMQPVLDKLGQVNIVGKPVVTFRNRTIVANKSGSAAPQPTPPPPTLSPSIEGFTATGGNTPGSPVVIRGMNLDNVTDVRFGSLSARFTRDSASQITAFVPENAITDQIMVTTSGGKSATSSARFSAQPKVTGFSTPNGNAPGASVIINGLNLDAATAVKFGKASGTINTKTPTQITVGIPNGAITGKLVVSTASGDVESSAEFVARPVINSITERAGAGETIEITGLNLAEPSAVVFGSNVLGEIVSKESTKITVKVPSNANTGKITVKTSGGEATSAQTFTIIPPPTITRLSADSGAVGATLVIQGTNLADAVEVKFGDVSAPIQSKTQTTINVTIPAGAKDGPIKVKTPGGEVSSTTFTVTP
jgi:hypothetical protein